MKSLTDIDYFKPSDALFMMTRIYNIETGSHKISGLDCEKGLLRYLCTGSRLALEITNLQGYQLGLRYNSNMRRI